MSDSDRKQAPTTAEIEAKFRSPAVVLSRPIILGGLVLLRTVRRFGWTPEGADQLSSLDGPMIFASNHLGHADTAAILGTLPRDIRDRTCVAAALDVFGSVNNNGHRRSFKALRRELVPHLVAAGFHAFAFDRHGPPLRSLRTAVELVRNGWSLLLYPEGTRSRTGEMAPFKAGVGVLAKMTGRPVVPIFVSGGDTILPCGQFMPGPGRALVRYGEPLRCDKRESAAIFTERLQKEVRALAPRFAETVPASHERPTRSARLASASISASGETGESR